MPTGSTAPLIRDSVWLKITEPNGFQETSGSVLRFAAGSVNPVQMEGRCFAEELRVSFGTASKGFLNPREESVDLSPP